MLINSLTQREKEVYYYYRQGLTQAQIARHLKLADPRVRQILTNVNRKLVAMGFSWEPCYGSQNIS